MDVSGNKQDEALSTMCSDCLANSLTLHCSSKKVGERLLSRTFKPVLMIQVQISTGTSTDFDVNETKRAKCCIGSEAGIQASQIGLQTASL
jgi:hypothetical protein